MTAFLNDSVDDQGLNWIVNTTQVLHITSVQASTYVQVSSISVGSSSPVSTTLGAGSPDGRQVTIASTSAGNVFSTATASSWCLVNSSGTLLVAAGDLSATQAVTSGNTFTLTSFTIRIPKVT